MNLLYLRDWVVVDVDDLVEIVSDYHGNLFKLLEVKCSVLYKPRQSDGGKITYSYLYDEQRRNKNMNK